MNSLKILEKVVAKKTYPTGNPNFSVMQAFPAGISAKNADPFLMCDYFISPSEGPASDPDEFPIGWHPHSGQDICTYLKQGVGRHADSMGNRGTFKTPGMQWISVGSGIEHAEGGGTPKGEMDEGFQLWFNTPAKYKFMDPRYGTEDPSSIPNLDLGGAKGRLLAGSVGEHKGPFKTVQPMQMIDFEFPPGASVDHTIPAELDNCLIFVYEGRGSVSGDLVKQFDVLRLDATDPGSRIVKISSDASSPMKAMLFAGKMIKEEIVWHGPFVMNTQKEIHKIIRDYQTGNFPPVRSSWDYKKAKPT